MSSKKSFRNLLSVSLSKGAPGAGSGASKMGSWVPSTAYPKGIWKGSESGCDEPILLGGCRTASMDAPWEDGRDGAAEAKGGCKNRRCSFGRASATINAGGGRAHAILVPEAHERSWGQKSGVMEEENGGIEV